MTNRKYAAGRRWEWAARDLLTLAGYKVMRSAGSKGSWDLAAWHSRRPVLFVQVKAGRRVKAAEARAFRQACKDLPITAEGTLWHIGGDGCARVWRGFTRNASGPDDMHEISTALLPLTRAARRALGVRTEPDALLAIDRAIAPEIKAK